jgi:hypothetical protein
MKTEILVTRTAKISYLSEDILEIVVLQDSEVEEEDARENYMACKKLSEGRKMAVLIDSRVRTTATKEARSLSSGPLVSEFVIARAILTDSVSVKLLGNFYINFHKPLSPTQLFRDKKKAIEWLEKELSKHQKTVKA